MQVDDPLLSAAEAAKFLGRKESTLAAWRHFGTGPEFVKFPNGPVAYKRSTLIAYRDQYVVRSTSDATTRGLQNERPLNSYLATRSIELAERKAEQQAAAQTKAHRTPLNKHVGSATEASCA